MHNYTETETHQKLKNAATQMKLAIEHNDNEEILKSCINAFISLARSVTFIMQEESSPYPELIKWYESKMNELKKLPIMKFFNERRVFSIHKGNIKPHRIDTPVTNIVYSTGEKIEKGTMTMWVFDGVNEYIPHDNGNVFRLCETYFIILKTLVKEWLETRERLL